jgi:voltage-gated potassium channel
MRKDDSLKERLHEIIFESDTRLGKLFDLVLLGLIFFSIVVVVLETIPVLHDRYFGLFYALEWFFTIVFTIEYVLRLYVVHAPMKYAKSPLGLIDLISILPTYLSIFIPGSQTLLAVRTLRLLRVFRILRLGQFMTAGQVISKALRSSRHKIAVFMFFVVQLVIVIGAVMYFVEGQTNPGFSSIPKSIYWAIVTLTTVGFGDITPQTALGQFLAALVMIMGYAIIAVPTGIVSAEMVASQKQSFSTQACRHCSREGHDDDAAYCKYCGWKLNENGG